MQVIFLTGYPGSGKGTQGKILSQILGIPHISTGELFRNEAKTGSEIGNKMKEYMDKGQIIPNDIHFEYLSSKLKLLTNGYILDGYPKNTECLDFILKEIDGCCQPIVIYLKIKRSTAFQRLSSRLFCENCELSFPKTDSICNKCSGSLVIRHDDHDEVIENRLDVFEKNTQPLFEKYKEMGIFQEIDGEQSQENVLIDILMKLYPNAAYANVESVFHNHVDAKDKTTLQMINQKIDQQMGDKYCKQKIYSVEHLSLCSQTKQNNFSSLYDQLPNFHEIKDASEEAFSTCKMGTKMNYDQELTTLDICFAHKKQKVMTEIEEELIKYDVSLKGTLHFTLIRHCKETIDWTKLGRYTEHNVVKSKLFELHHGFEIKKTSTHHDQLPISLELLSDMTKQYGFKNGGWFIFKDENRWLYRSNEFSEKSYSECIQILTRQSQELLLILKAICELKIIVSSSLERVHAIWPIDKKIVINSSNEDKLDEYRKYLIDYEVVSSAIETEEPDADSITIARYKTSQLPVGYVTDDVSLDVEGEDIGTNVKWHVKNKGLDKHIGKRAVFNCFIGVKSENDLIKIYKGSVPGKLVSPIGDGFGFGPYFLPDGAKTTLGEIMSEPHNARYLAIQNLLANKIYTTEPMLTEWKGKFQRF
jgi:adenylate kinase